MNQYGVLAVPKVTVFSMSPQPVSISCTGLFSLLLVVVVLVEFESCRWPRLNSWFLHNRMPILGHHGLLSLPASTYITKATQCSLSAQKWLMLWQLISFRSWDLIVLLLCGLWALIPAGPSPLRDFLYIALFCSSRPCFLMFLFCHIGRL